MLHSFSQSLGTGCQIIFWVVFWWRALSSLVFSPPNVFFSWSLVIYWLYLLLCVTQVFGFLNLSSVSRAPTSSFTLCPLDSLVHSPSVFQFPYLRPRVTICWMNKCLPSSNLCSLGMAVSSVPGVLQIPYDSWHLSRALCLLPGQVFQLLLTFNFYSNARVLFQSFSDCVSSVLKELHCRQNPKEIHC